VVSDPLSFSIGYVGDAGFQLTVLQRRASIFGVSRRLREALKVILNRLKTDAREWGEPQFTMKGMRTVVRSAMHDGIRVSYAVHEDQPVVFIRHIRAAVGHPLHRQD
jgi:hypothetical protein